MTEGDDQERTATSDSELPTGTTLGDIRRLDRLPAAGNPEAARRRDEALAKVRTTLLSSPAWQEQSERIAESFAELSKVNTPKIAEAIGAWQKVQPTVSKLDSLGPVSPVHVEVGAPEIVEIEPLEPRMLNTLEAMLERKAA